VVWAVTVRVLGIRQVPLAAAIEISQSGHDSTRLGPGARLSAREIAFTLTGRPPAPAPQHSKPPLAARTESGRPRRPAHSVPDQCISGRALGVRGAVRYCR
jgi:hypothetical protein